MENNQPSDERRDQAVDERGTSPAEGLEILKRLRDQGFDGSSEKLALALGRPTEEVEHWMDGSEQPDDDIIMKSRGIAMQRQLQIG